LKAINLRIIYDYQIFSMEEYGGISRYFNEVASRIVKTGENKVRILAPIYINRYLKHNKSNIVIGKYIPDIPKTKRIRKCLNTLISESCMHILTADIVHETYYADSKLSSKNIKTVVTVLDMIHEKYRNYFRDGDKTSFIKNKAVNRADHVICISENTKKDLMEIFHVESSKISVVYLGHSLTITAPRIEGRIIADPYILYVGTRQGYKNFAGLLQAFVASHRLKNDFRLVCFGGRGLSSAELNEIHSLGLAPNRVVQVSGDDRILANLYQYASIFVYPSLYEGFGIPPLEAMSCKCPVACSHTSSLPEVAGDAAEYFDPYDTESIRSAIETVVYSIDKSETLIARGLARLNLFSWEACAQQTSAVYASLL
jgi:glycosyltransferase involved in cell wall biosynthesis